MSIHIVGRESKILGEIRAGRKTVEVRLAKPRFLAFQVGDKVHIREDHLINGKIVDGELSNIYTKVTKVERFPSFRDLLDSISYKSILPYAKSKEEALDLQYQFYTPEQEKELGVLAIHFKLIE